MSADLVGRETQTGKIHKEGGETEAAERPRGRLAGFKRERVGKE